MRPGALARKIGPALAHGSLFSTFTPLEVPPLPLTLLTSSRFTAGHAKRYVDKMHSQHRRGEAPPGQVDNAKVDWSGVGAR